MKDIYNCVKLVPDMVLSLSYSDIQIKRNGCYVCLRNDIEKTFYELESSNINGILEELFGKKYIRRKCALSYLY